jgi:hypothetical protein
MRARAPSVSGMKGPIERRQAKAQFRRIKTHVHSNKYSTQIRIDQMVDFELKWKRSMALGLFNEHDNVARGNCDMLSARLRRLIRPCNSLPRNDF